MDVRNTLDAGKDLVEQLFLKKRFIVEGWLAEWDVEEPSHPDYEVWTVEDMSDDRLDEVHRSFLQADRSFLTTAGSGILVEVMPHVTTRRDRVRDRLRREASAVFLAVEEETNVPAGYVWAYVPQDDAVALGIPLDAGTFYRFDAFTAKSHRRKGVSTLVRWAAANWALERGCERYVAHFDVSNEVAQLAHKDEFLSTPTGDNYLVRAGGVPVLSVTDWIDTPGITVNYLLAENEFS